MHILRVQESPVCFQFKAGHRLDQQAFDCYAGLVSGWNGSACKTSRQLVRSFLPVMLTLAVYVVTE